MTARLIGAGDLFPDIGLSDLSGRGVQLVSGDFSQPTLLFVWASW